MNCFSKTSTPAERSPTESAESLKPIAERKDIVETISSDNSDSTDDSTDDLADETLQEKINRLALETSTEDPDFVVSVCDRWVGEILSVK